MIITGFLFGDLEPDDVATSWQKMGYTTRDALLIFGALTVLTLVLLIWAAFLRRRRRHHSSHHRHHHSREPIMPSTEASESEPIDSRPRRRKWRRRRRDHRPRNPTLAETGGLPPVRTEEPPDSTR